MKPAYYKIANWLNGFLVWQVEMKSLKIVYNLNFFGIQI